jgi:hypothetical protein
LCLWVGSPEHKLKKIFCPHNLFHYSIAKEKNSDKTHLKRVITKKITIFGVSPNLACFCNNFFRCILSLRLVCFFQTSIKFWVFFIPIMTYFRKKIFLAYTSGWRNIRGRLPIGYVGEKNVSMLVQDFLPTIGKC